MALVLGGFRSRTRMRRGAGPGKPSIREVCLLGVEAARSNVDPTPGDSGEGLWIPGERMTWSGRSYRVEATGVRAGCRGEPRHYVHLALPGSALG